MVALLRQRQSPLGRPSRIGYGSVQRGKVAQMNHWNITLRFTAFLGVTELFLWLSLTPTRTADPRDLLADAVGAALLYAAVRVMSRVGSGKKRRG